MMTSPLELELLLDFHDEEVVALEVWEDELPKE